MFKKFRKGRTRELRAGLHMEQQSVALAVVKREPQGKQRLEHWFCDSAEDAEAAADSAWASIGRVELRRAPLNAVMPAGEYQLLQVEAPDVPEEELPAAVRWRIKNLLEYPVNDAVVDVFRMPEQSNAAHRPMLYSVSASTAKVNEHAKRMNSSGFELDAIDIPELCIRNVAGLLPQDAHGVAFLYFAPDYGILTVTRAGLLHLVRRIEFGRSSLEALQGDDFGTRELLSGISLEIQRSLDYYESHYDQRTISDLVLGPGLTVDTVATTLKEDLGLNVQSLDLNDYFETEQPLAPEDQGNCLLAVGAALRLEKAAA